MPDDITKPEDECAVIDCTNEIEQLGCLLCGFHVFEGEPEDD